MRLIDADALIDEIKYITGQDTIMWFDDRRIKREQEVNMAAFIERMPTIDPVKQGKWIKDKNLYKCTACNDLCAVAGWANCIPEEQMYKAFKFCPNCGALMDKGEPDDH